MFGPSPSLFSHEGADTPFSRIDPRFKILTCLAAGVGAVVASDAYQIAVMVGVVLVLVGFGRVSFRVLRSSLVPLALFTVIGGAVLIFETPGNGLSFLALHVSRNGLALAGRLTAELLMLVTLSTTLTWTTSPLSLANGLRQLLGWLGRLRVPVDDMTTMLVIAVTFVPVMTDEIDRQLTARQARGARVSRFGMWTVLGDMLPPLLESNLQRGAELADALDARYYGLGRRTHRDGDNKVGWQGPVALACVCATVALTLFVVP